MPHSGEYRTMADSIAAGTVALGASPATFTAPVFGMAVISGGVLTLATLARKGISAPMPVLGGVQMAIGDTLTIIYTVVPTLTWFPSN